MIMTLIRDRVNNVISYKAFLDGENYRDPSVYNAFAGRSTPEQAQEDARLRLLAALPATVDIITDYESVDPFTSFLPG